MSVYEVMSIVSLCISTFIAVSCFLVPILINESNKHREQKQKLFNLVFEEQFSVINNFANAYANWKGNPMNKQSLISTIYWTATMTNSEVSTYLTNLSDAVSNDSTNTDELFFQCKSKLLNFFGIFDNSRAPKDIISIRLRIAIRRKYKF